MAFADHFSARAEAYSRHRPDYPDELFAYLAEQAPRRAVAWDCGTGNGQAAVGLAARFAVVLASDASVAQLALARPQARVAYAAATAEAPPFADRCADLVTVAQAYHWVDADRFAAAARQVAAGDAVIAAWSYARCAVAPDVDGLIERLYAGVLGPWWPPERALVEDGYRGIRFPFAETAAPAFALSARWTCDRFLGYVRSWSAAKAFHEATGRDAVAEAGPELSAAWGDGERLVSWPLALRVGRVHGR
jgi:hypothetical protein